MKVGHERFTIYEVEEVHKAMLLELNAQEGLEVDLQGVQKIDTAAIQLLLSAYKTCQRDAKVFSLVNISSELRHTIDTVRCMPELGNTHE